jgi:DNA polymerase-3 subunit delta'
VLKLHEIAGQTAAVEMLRRVLRSGRVPQALLFHGAEGVGKATAATAFAAALLCEREGDAPCGACDSCSLIDKNGHPDFLLVGRLTRKEIQKKETSRLATGTPDAGEGDLGAQILVDQVRKLNGLVGLRPRLGRRRVFLIDPAECMNREAQNALLKTLEDTPDHSVLILASSRPHLLLPTVRSRCFGVGFASLRADDLARLLASRGISRDEAAARAALSSGSPGRALALNLEERHERRREIYEILETLSSGTRGLEGLPAMAVVLAGKDESTLRDGLDMLEGLLRDALRTGATDDDGLIHPDLAGELRRVADRIGTRRAAQLVSSVERLRGDLRFNTNRTLIAEALLVAVAGGPLP